MPDYLQGCKLTRVKAASAAGQTAVNSDAVDMRGYDAVLFFTTAGTITSTAVTSIAVQQSSDNGSSDTFAALAGASVAIADDDDGQTFGIQVLRPRERYLRAVVSRGTANSAFGEIYALQFESATRPVDNTVTDTATFLALESPVEA